jgi:predicted O-linked N-acetylglucosamine transferase (SPINDLY family)
MNIDYLISDKNLIKSNETNLYKEDVLFMPNIWNALSAPEKLPEITDKSNEKNSDFVFCSFNNFQKISDRTIDVWSKILNTTKSKLLLKNSLIGGEDLKNNVLDKFISKGLQKDQIIFLEREKNIYDHLKLYNKANVALDTFPYPGVTTSYEAMLMGLPVLTMQGFNFNSRCGESINKNVIMDNLIAKDDHDYLNIAISLTKDLKLNEKYGENLRKKALSSPLFNTDQFTRDFEELITKVYNKN